MSEPGGRGRSSLRLPRVEFDLTALLLGAGAWLAWAATWPLLGALLGVETTGLKFATPGGAVDAAPGPALRSAMLTELQRVLPIPGTDRLVGALGHPGTLVRASEKSAGAFESVRLDLPAWKFAAAAGALLLLWSVLGGAIARVYALRKARDETIGFDQALGFSVGSLRQFVLAPVFTLAAGALFVAVLLACGAASAIPYAGPVIQVVAQPLAALAAVVTGVIVLGLVFGFPILQAAVAVERNGSLDAVSRTFSYVWTRPVPFAVGAIVVLAVGGMIETVGSWMLAISQGVFVLGASWVDSDLAGKLVDAFRAVSTLGAPTTDGLAGMQAASVWIAWAVGSVTLMLARGFVVSYVVGGFTDLYFLLREEVDGVDGSEVFVEGAGASLGEPVPGEPKQQ
jgi:hypothetical protein